MDCLEARRLEPEFSGGCRDAIEAALADRASDFRLDASLRRACRQDIERTCVDEFESRWFDVLESTSARGEASP